MQPCTWDIEKKIKEYTRSWPVNQLAVARAPARARSTGKEKLEYETRQDEDFFSSSFIYTHTYYISSNPGRNGDGGSDRTLTDKFPTVFCPTVAA